MKPCASRRKLKAGGQLEQVLAHFKVHGSMTVRDAMRKGISSYHRRLFELRRRGHPIDHGEFETARGGARFKRYRMDRH